MDWNILLSHLSQKIIYILTHEHAQAILPSSGRLFPRDPLLPWLEGLGHGIYDSSQIQCGVATQVGESQHQLERILCTPVSECFRLVKQSQRNTLIAIVWNSPSCDISMDWAANGKQHSISAQEPVASWWDSDLRETKTNITESNMYQRYVTNRLVTRMKNKHTDIYGWMMDGLIDA